MTGVNKVIILGHLGGDPLTQRIDGNKIVSKFSVATTDHYTIDGGERVEQTDWHNIVLYGRLAEVAQKYLQKGSKVYVEGKLKTRSWEDKDGKKCYITEVIGNNIQLLGSNG